MNIIAKNPSMSACLVTKSSPRRLARACPEQLLKCLTAPLLFSMAFLVAGAPNAAVNNLWPGSGPALASDFEDEAKPHWCDGDYDERTGFCQDAYTGEWYSQFGETYGEYVPAPENERAWFDLGLFDEDYDREEDIPWCDVNFYEFGNIGILFNWSEGDWIVSIGPFSCGDNEDDDPENNEGSRDNWP